MVSPAWAVVLLASVRFWVRLVAALLSTTQAIVSWELSEASQDLHWLVLVCRPGILGHTSVIFTVGCGKGVGVGVGVGVGLGAGGGAGRPTDTRLPQLYRMKYVLPVMLLLTCSAE